MEGIIIVKEILLNQKGQTFLENLLYVILFVFVIAVFINSLAGAVGEKFGEMTERVNQIGN